MPSELPEVRIARPEDEDEIMAMCRRLWSENGLFSFSDDKVRSCLRKCYGRQGTIVGVIGRSGSIEASTCLAISDFYYTTDWHLGELWNYVEPEYRRSRNAEALIEFGKACSEKMQIPFFTGIVTNRSMAGKVRLYRRSLGYPTGAFFIHNANWKPEPMEDHTDLRARLKEAARACTEKRGSSAAALRKQLAQLAQLLSEAAAAVGSEDNLWGSAAGTRPENGAASHVNGSG